VLGVVSIALVAAALAWWRGSARTPSPADPLAALDGRAALREGLARIDRGEKRASLRYFEHALERGTGRDAEVVALYAAALQDVALDSAMRSSVERTRMMQLALREIERVVARTPEADHRAESLFQHSYVLRVVGFPVDALLELNLAASSLPGEEVIDAARYGLAQRLESPEDPAR